MSAYYTPFFYFYSKVDIKNKLTLIEFICVNKLHIQ